MKVLLLFFAVVVYPLVPQALALDEMNKDFGLTKYVNEKYTTKYRPEYRYNYNYDLGNTTNFNMPSIQIKPSVVDCDNDSSKGLRIDPKVSVFANIGDEIAGLNACEAIQSDEINRFSEANCRLTVACSKIKMNKDEGNLMSFFTIPKMISEDFVGMTLEKNIVKMGKIDALRKFAEKKFGKKIGEICTPRFNHVYEPEAIDTCDSSVVDSGFARMQESCSLTRESCYNSGINDPQKDFNVFLKLNPPLKESESALQLFMDKRTDGMVNNSLANDSEMLENLSAIITSKDNKDIKLQNIFNKLVDYRTQGKLDPLFGFLSDFDSSTGLFKKSSHYSFFEKLVLSNSSAESIRSSIEKYRMETSKKILNEDCDITPSFASICKDATAVMKSKRILVPDKKFASFRIARDSDDMRYTMLKSLYPNGIQNLADFSIIMEAQRCKAFGFSAPKSATEKMRELAVGSNDPSSMFDQENSSFEYGFGLRLEQNDVIGALTRSAFRYSKPEETIGPQFGPVDANHPLVKEKDPVPAIVETAVLSDEELKARSASPDKVERKFDSLSEDMSEGLQQSANVTHSAGLNTTNGFLNGSSFNNLNHSMGKSSESDDYSDNSIDKEKKSKSSNDSLNDKIFELSRKLSASEDNLERIKTEKEVAQQEKEKKIKIDEENKTIAELKNQINTFKAQAKKDADSSNTTKKDIDSETGASLSSNMKAQNESKSSTQDAAQSATVHNQSNVSNSASSASSEGSSGSQNSASVRSTINAGASSAVSSDFKTSLVFTKIDDLSTEKASEQIYAKILELKGAPFYIEEGGVMKEIIPKVVNDVVVVDKFGMPVYEKVVVNAKDKVGKMTKKGKTPASISTKADLLKDQEEKLKYERIQYLKLKKITNDVLNKNN